MEAPKSACDMKLVQLVVRMCSLSLLMLGNLFVSLCFKDATRMQRRSFALEKSSMRQGDVGNRHHLPFNGLFARYK